MNRLLTPKEMAADMAHKLDKATADMDDDERAAFLYAVCEWLMGPRKPKGQQGGVG